MRYLLLFLIALHGLIHLMGFAKAYGFAEMSQLKQPISATAGLAWLAGALAFLTAGGLYLLRQDSWCWVALIAAAVSQALIFSVWSDAKFGTAANVIVLLAATASVLEARPGAYHNRYDAVVREALAAQSGMPPLTEADLSHLPAIVRKYIRETGAVGRPKVSSFRIVFNGEFRNGFDKPAMPFRSEQVNTLRPMMRAFLMKATMYGVPAEGFHLFRDGHASMQIKLASAMQVVNASGPVMDQSETVTFFNDLCFFAPAALIDREHIQWEAEEPLAVRAAFRQNGVTIHARLFFNQAGELIDFVSEDRSYSADGKTYEKYPWSTPVQIYTVMEGRKVPGRAEAVWHTPAGPFIYGKFNLVEIEYNEGDKKR